jgi:hypothetical protein
MSQLVPQYEVQKEPPVRLGPPPVSTQDGPAYETSGIAGVYSVKESVKGTK